MNKGLKSTTELRLTKKGIAMTFQLNKFAVFSVSSSPSVLLSVTIVIHGSGSPMHIFSIHILIFFIVKILVLFSCKKIVQVLVFENQLLSSFKFSFVRELRMDQVNFYRLKLSSAEFRKCFPIILNFLEKIRKV